jgi:putative membrane protein
MWLHGPLFGGFPLFLMLLAVPVVLLLLVRARRGLRGSRRGACGPGLSGPGARPPGSDARALLDQRYARGELDREQYLKMKEDLRLP